MYRTVERLVGGESKRTYFLAAIATLFISLIFFIRELGLIDEKLFLNKFILSLTVIFSLFIIHTVYVQIGVTFNHFELIKYSILHAFFLMLPSIYSFAHFVYSFAHGTEISHTGIFGIENLNDLLTYQVLIYIFAILFYYHIFKIRKNIRELGDWVAAIGIFGVTVSFFELMTIFLGKLSLLASNVVASFVFGIYGILISTPLILASAILPIVSFIFFIKRYEQVSKK